jgi:pimeloyl-ACP methyl ester carboxylesterase
LLHARELGDGPPVVFLHPGPGLDGSVFLPGAERLAATHRVILLDLPGNGRSPGLAADDVNLAGFARAVEGFVRERGLDHWTLLGHSFGGYVAMQHLGDFPGSAARVVASCTDCDEEEPPGAPEDPFEGLPEEVAAGIRDALEREDGVRSPEECRAVWADQMPFFVGSPDRLDTVLAAFADVAYEPEMHRERDWGDLHALGALAASEVPILAIAGEHDRSSPPVCARRIAATAPRGELLVIEGAGHFPFAETPEAYWDGLGAWLARTAP